MSGASPFERLLRRDRIITIAGLAALCVLAWTYIATGAGIGMSAWDMTNFALFTHRQGSAMAGMDMGAVQMWRPATWLLMTAMWWIMMIAMMTPSAAPAILLYARVHRHENSQGQIDERRAPTGAFAAGYLLVWLGFAIAATALHALLERSGFVSAGMMGSRSHWLSGGVLIAAGLYQFSPFKNVCLSHCRAPAAFLSRHWRPGARGALRIGVIHGAYCVGCCWALMLLLFVGGVMNLVWIAALACLVLAEKLLPPGRGIGLLTGVVLIGWGLVTLTI